MKKKTINRDTGHRTRESFLALGLFILLTALYTWPWFQHFDTRVPGGWNFGGDTELIVWEAWHFAYALGHGTNPFHTSMLFYPYGASLAYDGSIPLHGVYQTLLQPWLGLLRAFNAGYLVSFCFSAWGAYMLAREYGLSFLAGLLAGFVFGFAPVRMGYISAGHLAIVSTEAVPFFLLFLTRYFRKRRRLDALWASVFLGLQAWAEQVSVFWCLGLGLLLFIFHDRPRDKVPAFGWAQALALSLPFLVLLAPFLSAVLSMDSNVYSYNGSSLSTDLRQFGRYLGGGLPLQDLVRHFQSNYAVCSRNSADLTALFTPSFLHPVFHRFFSGDSAFYSYENTVFLGWTCAALLVSGFFIKAFRRKEAGMWLAAFLFFLIFSLGPALRANASLVTVLGLPLPLPFLLTQYLPVIKNFHVPARLMVLAMLGLGLTLGFCWDRWKEVLAGRRIWSWLAGSLAAAGLLFEFLCFPLPLYQYPPIPDIYRVMARDPEPCTVLEIPFMAKDGMLLYGKYMKVSGQTYQIVHQKNIISGYVSRIPRRTGEALAADWVLNDLDQRQKVPGSFPPERAEVGQWREFLSRNKVRYIVLHRTVLCPESAEFFSRWIVPEAGVLSGEDYLCFDLGHRAVPGSASLELDRELSQSEAVIKKEGAGAAGALVHLTDADWRRQCGAAALLARGGEKNIPGLVQGLRDSDEESSLMPVYALSRMAGGARNSLGLLEKIIQRPGRSYDLKNMAVYSVGKMGAAAKPAVPVLIEAMSDGRLLSSCVMALGNIGPEAGPAVASLKPLLLNWSLSLPAAKALARIHPPLASLKQEIKLCLASPYWNVRLSGEYLLKNLR